MPTYMYTHVPVTHVMEACNATYMAAAAIQVRGKYHTADNNLYMHVPEDGWCAVFDDTST